MTTETHYDEMTIEDAAMEAAGNWRTFDCFSWWRERDLDRPNDWMIHYTHHRDSGLLDQSNAEQIRKALEPFTEGDNPELVEESHNHWAVDTLMVSVCESFGMARSQKPSGPFTN